MSSYAELYVRGVSVLSFRNVVYPEILLLFTRADLIIVQGKEREEVVWRTKEQFEVEEPFWILRTTVAEMRDRLECFGIGPIGVRTLYSELHDRHIAPPYFSEYAFLVEAHRARLGFWETLTFEDWCVATRGCIDKGEARWERGHRDGSLKDLLSIWPDDDARWVLAAVLQCLDPDDFIDVDISDLIHSERLEEAFDPQRDAVELLTIPSVFGSPPIILTEGSTDARCLQLAIDVLKPHLASYLRFPDFSGGVDGGAPTLVRTLKAFSAAGIRNRVVALFDNDTAASDAIRGLTRANLSSNFIVLRYPDLPLARDYPCLGPGGGHRADVNGLACSLELYMGRDSLSDSTGALHAVRWGGHFPALNAYQGEVTGKSEIRKHYEQKAESALRDHAQIANQDWSGMELILDSIIAALELKEPDLQRVLLEI